MALINCPECNKEMSDTIKKCPHCGFVIKKKKVKKDKSVKGEKKKLKDKIINLLKNKKFWISFLIVIVVLFLIALFVSTIQLNRINKAVEYLEDEDYECEKIDDEYNYYNYVCTLEKDGALYEYLLSYDDSFWERVLMTDYFSVSFTYSDDEYFFRLNWEGFVQLRPFRGDNTLENRTDDDGMMQYTVSDNKIEYDECWTYSSDSYFYDYDDVRKCEILNEHYEKYAEIIKDVSDEYEDLYEEVGKDFEWPDY